MRYYGLADWLQTAATAARVDIETLRLRLVDMDAAILMLLAGGGPRAYKNDVDDVAEKTYRLLRSHVNLYPFLGGRHDAVAAASAADYASARGYVLELPDRGIPMVNLVDGDALDGDDLRRGIRRALRPAPVSGGTRSTAPDLRGVQVCVCRAVGNPTPALKQISDDLVERIDPHLRMQRAQVRLPAPRQRVGRDGRRVGPTGTGLAASSTGELFTRSMQRLCPSHLVVAINDPQGQGTCVEREWALRLGIPVIELSLHESVSVHQDGPGRVWTIRVNPDRPAAAFAQFTVALRRLTPTIRDRVATCEALAIKNEAALAYLRASWESLRAEAREWVSARAQMSRPYIDGLLTSCEALELAGASQRRRLELLLHSPQVARAVSVELSDRELELVGTAAERAGLRGASVARAVDFVRTQRQRSRTRGGIRDRHEAANLVAAAIESLGLK